MNECSCTHCVNVTSHMHEISRPALVCCFCSLHCLVGLCLDWSRSSWIPWKHLLSFCYFKGSAGILEQEGYQNIKASCVNSTYHEVLEHQIWFPFVKGLVHYNIFRNDKLLITKSLPRHLKHRQYQMNAGHCEVSLSECMADHEAFACTSYIIYMTHQNVTKHSRPRYHTKCTRQEVMQASWNNLTDT